MGTESTAVDAEGGPAGPPLPFLWPIHSVAGETQPLPALFPGPLSRLLQWAQDALHPPLTGR